MNNFNNFRRRMRRGADGNTFTVSVEASANGVGDGGLTDERLALISAEVIGQGKMASPRRLDANR